jgi:osmotically-inducible protein OsmY
MNRLIPYVAAAALAAALAVKAAIATEPGLKDAEIIAKTDGGMVVLTGTAKSQDQIALASNLAQRQEGVSRVDTQIAVK